MGSIFGCHNFFGINQKMVQLFAMIETSSLYETLIFGLPLSTRDRILKDFEIRLKPYSEVPIEDLLWVLDFNFSDHINPSVMLNRKISTLRRIESDKTFKVQFDQLTKILKFRKEIKLVFPN